MIVAGGTLQPGGLEILVGFTIIAMGVALDTVFVRHHSPHIGRGGMRMAEKMLPELVKPGHLGSHHPRDSGARMTEDAPGMMVRGPRGAERPAKGMHFVAGQTESRALLKPASRRRDPRTKEQNTQKNPDQSGRLASFQGSLPSGHTRLRYGQRAGAPVPAGFIL